MKNDQLGRTKSAVVTSLHARLVARSASGALSERAPGSRDAVGVEKAIDYALSARRTQPNPAFLERDVLRNARLAVRRAADAEVRAAAEIASACAPTHAGFAGLLRVGVHATLEIRASDRPRAHRGGAAGKVAGTAMVASVTPEDVAVASDQERRLRAKVRSELGELASRVLDGMLADEDGPETARRLGVSRRTVERTRTKIRTLAATVLTIPVAA